MTSVAAHPVEEAFGLQPDVANAPVVEPGFRPVVIEGIAEDPGGMLATPANGSMGAGAAPSAAASVGWGTARRPTRNREELARLSGLLDAFARRR